MKRFNMGYCQRIDLVPYVTNTETAKLSSQFKNLSKMPTAVPQRSLSSKESVGDGLSRLSKTL